MTKKRRSEPEAAPKAATAKVMVVLRRDQAEALRRAALELAIESGSRPDASALLRGLLDEHLVSYLGAQRRRRKGGA